MKADRWIAQLEKAGLSPLEASGSPLPSMSWRGLTLGIELHPSQRAAFVFEDRISRAAPSELLLDNPHTGWSWVLTAEARVARRVVVSAAVWCDRRALENQLERLVSNRSGHEQEAHGWPLFALCSVVEQDGAAGLATDIAALLLHWDFNAWDGARHVQPEGDDLWGMRLVGPREAETRARDEARTLRLLTQSPAGARHLSQVLSRTKQPIDARADTSNTRGPS